jgi:VIT1/CCC1 family predicted Fe2+/Mn2+ transporter
MSSYLVALGASIGIAIAIIFVFNYYISVAKDYSFRRRFFGMAGVSLGVALISFLIGYAVRTFIGLEI